MADWLIDRIREHGDGEAVVCNGHSTRYGELFEAVQDWRDRLSQAGVGKGAVVALVGDFSPQVIAAFLSLTLENCIVVPLTIGSFEQNPDFLDIAEVQFVITPDAASKIDARGTTPANSLTRGLIDGGEAGLVLFTSGSTGVSKAAIHGMNALLEKFRVRRPAHRTLTFLLLDHIGGVNTFFHVIANGGVIASTDDRTPRGVFRVVQDARVEILPVSPTFLNLCLLSGAHRNFDISSLRKITYGTEPMPQSTLDRLVEEFPDIQFQQTYGLSEVGIMRSKSRSDGSLWVRIGGDGYETKIIDGILWIRSSSAMLGYLNAPSPFDAEGWFNTHDMVEVDGDYFKIPGRDSEIINVGGEKVYPAEVESHILEIDNIRDVVVYGIANALSGQAVAAKVNLIDPESERDVKKRIRLALRDKVAPFKIPQKVVVTDSEQYNQRFKHLRLQQGQDQVS